MNVPDEKIKTGHSSEPRAAEDNGALASVSSKPEQDDTYVGTTIGDRYSVIEMVGQGGMGVVYKVLHKQLNKPLALKMLPGSKGLDRSLVARFDAEAKAASALHHPNLAGIHDYGTTSDGSPYLVMDFVDGCTLMDKITKQGAVEQKEALKIFLQVCEGLEYAHRKGIIHRDIKPSNIMVSGSGDKQTACVVDFGIAKEMRTDDTATGLTQTGMLLGSPKYMSPEQVSGSPVDSRTDIYSLGCAMFETLTGQPVFTGDNAMQLMYKHLNERPPLFKLVAPNTVINGSLERVVMQMLEKEPENRYQSISDLKRDLDLIAAGKNPVKEVARMRSNVQSLMRTGKMCLQISLIAVITLIPVVVAWKMANAATPWGEQRNLAQGQMNIGPNNYVEALGYYKKALAEAKRGKAPADDEETILLEMARVQGYLHQYGKSIDSLNEALALNSTHWESDNTAFIIDELANDYLETGRYADAEKAARKAVEIKRRRFGEVNWFTGHSVSRLTHALRSLKKYDEAELCARELVNIETKLYPQEDNIEVANAHHSLTNVLADEGKTDEAVKEADKTLALMLKLQGADSPQTSNFVSWYVGYLKYWHRDEHAAEVAKQVPAAADKE